MCICYSGNVCLSMSLFFYSVKGSVRFKFCLSVLYWYESPSESRRLCFWISSFRMKFLIWHLSLAKPRGLSGKQKAKRKKKNPASVRRCLFPWWYGACACVYDDLTHAYSPRQPLLLPGCRQRVCLHTAHGAVTCQAAVYRRTLCSKREIHKRKSPAQVCLLVKVLIILTTYSSGFLLSWFPVLVMGFHGILGAFPQT